MSENDTVSIFSRIVADPGACVGSIALVLNVIIVIVSFVINYFWIRKRIVDERNYQINLRFYQIAVLDSLKELTDFAAQMDKLFVSLVDETRNATSQSSPPRPIVEKYQEKLDSMHRALVNGALSFYRGYSKKLHKELEKLLETAYDEATIIFSKFDRATIDAEFARKKGNDIACNSAHYIEKLFEIVKRYCPQSG